MLPQATNLAALINQGTETPLSPKDEYNYRLWALMNKVPESDDYNMRGFWKASQEPANKLNSSINPNDGQMHYPDTFKLPNHPSFSTESGYFDPRTMPQTPSWEGGQIGNTDQQSWTLRRPNGSVVVREAPWVKKD